MIHRGYAHLLHCTLTLALGLALATPARADVAVIVPPIQDVSSDLAEPAIEEITRLLKVYGFDVISAGQAGSAADDAQQRGGFAQGYDPFSCVTAQCADEYRRLFDASFAVQLSVTMRGVRPSAVSIVLTEAPGSFFAGSAPVEGRDIRAAARGAFQAARAKQEEGTGPWLSVTGTPEGAMVYLDESEYGRIPFTKRHVEPGAHRLEIRGEQHLPERRTLEVPSNIEYVEQITVALKPNVARAAAPPRRARLVARRTIWDWALGGAVAAVSAAHLAAGIYQRTIAGDCFTSSEGRCVERYGDSSAPARENLLIGFGAAGLALSAVVIGVGPIGRLQMRAHRDSAQLQLRGEF